MKAVGRIESHSATFVCHMAYIHWVLNAFACVLANVMRSRGSAWATTAIERRGNRLNGDSHAWTFAVELDDQRSLLSGNNAA
jgi:hypothetical protein